VQKIFAGVGLGTRFLGPLAKGAVRLGAKAAGVEATAAAKAAGRAAAAEAAAVERAAARSAAQSGTRVTGDALKAARAEFNSVKPAYWRNEAATNPGAWSTENLARMKGGKAPIGSDGFPMELHHSTPLAEGGTNAFSNLKPLTRSEHRLGPNYKLNHPNLP
jgi:hypothetical protein